jgi:thiamine transport system permease protein
MTELLRTSRIPRFAALPAIAWLLGFAVLPIIVMVTRFVGFNDVERVLSRTATWRVVWFSTWQAGLSVVCTFFVAAPVTWILGRYEFRGRRLLRALTTVGFLLPSVVVGAGFLALLPTSIHNSPLAIVLAHAYFNIAVVVRVVGARLELVDRRLVDAARTLGVSAIRSYRDIVWPLIRSAVTSAAGVVFLYCFTSFAVIRIVGGPTRNTIESDIALRAFGIGDVAAATVLGGLQAVMIVVVFAMFRHLGGRNVLQRQSGILPRATRHVRPRLVIVAFGTVLFVAAPLVSLAWRSLHVGDVVSLSPWTSIFDTSLRESIVASLRTATLAGVIGVALAATVAMSIVRLQKVGRLLDMFTFLPLAISPVMLGLGLVVTFDARWYDWRGEWWFVSIVHTLVALPLVVRVLVPAWHAIPLQLHDAAAVLGAGEVRRLVDIDLRLIRRAVAAGLGLVLAVSLGEFGAASILSRSGAETMPVTIGRLLSRTGDLVRAQAFALSTLLVLLCFVALLFVEAIFGRNRDAQRH